MIIKSKPPLLEFDSEKTAIIEPSLLIDKKDVPETCVISFFNDVMKPLARDSGAKIIHVFKEEHGVHPIYEIEHQKKRLAFFHPGVGAPLASGMLEEAIALGCKKFIVCGGCGVLVPNIKTGETLLITSAVRDEGTSYHYHPPSREIETDKTTLAKITKYLNQKDVKYVFCKTWTTDAIYRETKNKLKKRIKDGCSCVEMEASALLSVAKFRNVELGITLYAGDNLSGEKWSSNDWDKLIEIRTKLFWLSADVCVNL